MGRDVGKVDIARGSFVRGDDGMFVAMVTQISACAKMHRTIH